MKKLQHFKVIWASKKSQWKLGILEMNNRKNITRQNMWNTVKSVTSQEEFIASRENNKNLKGIFICSMF